MIVGFEFDPNSSNLIQIRGFGFNQMRFDKSSAGLSLKDIGQV